MKVNHKKLKKTSTQLRKKRRKTFEKTQRERRGREGGKGIYARSVLYTCIIVTERFKRRYLIYMYMYAFLYTKSARL